MTKKKTTKELAANLPVADKIKESARQIWLAGLGAYNKAEEDAGKFFEKLVREGEELESMTRGAVEKQFKVVEDTVGEVREKASDAFGKLENVFDKRVSAALVRLGFPAHKKIDALEKRIRELEHRLDRLESDA
jgi:poly(hydroxyalkanoate) granule-associated protein